MDRTLVGMLILTTLAACAGDGTGLGPNGRPLATGVEVTPADAAVVVGGLVQLQSVTTDPQGNPTTETVTWSSGDEAVAIVSASGLVTGVGPGTTNITAATAVAMTAAPVTVVGSASFAADVQTIFNTSCAFANGCHAGPMPPQGQDLSTGNAYANIVSVASMELPSMLRINPGNPLTSYLVHKIRGTHLQVGGTGVRMPFGGQLPQNEIDIVRAWVQNGAPNN